MAPILARGRYDGPGPADAGRRVGYEDSWRIGEFYGQSECCDPRGQMLAVGRRDAADVVIADLPMGPIRAVRQTWQFCRDRRPEIYGPLNEL